MAEKTQVSEKERVPFTKNKPQTSRGVFRKNQRHSQRKARIYDKNGIQMQMYRQYAHSKRGKQVNIRISGKRHAQIGLVAAQCEGALLAPLTYSGTTKASVFEK